MVIFQSNESTSSNATELDGLKRSLEFLESEGVQPSLLVTDRNPSAKKFMREERPDIKHKFDIWHVAKSMYTILLIHTYFGCNCKCLISNDFATTKEKETFHVMKHRERIREKNTIS